MGCCTSLLYRMTVTIQSVGIFTPRRDQRACRPICEDLLNALRRLSLLSGLVRPK